MTTIRDTLTAYAAACREAIFRGAPPPDRPDLDLRGADLFRANLSGAILTRAKFDGVDLRYADLSGANLRNADVSLANLTGANLSGATLLGVVATGAIMRCANLRGADLSGADLEGADLIAADLRRAKIRGAALRGADLRRADIRGAALRYAMLDGADLRGVVGLPLDDTDRAALRRAVAAQISAHPETHDQIRWHSHCGTVHCVAGWAVVLAGDVGRELERRYSTGAAANLLFGGERRPSFDPTATREDILRDLAAD